MPTFQEQVPGAHPRAKADSSLVILWWIWLVAALLALPLPMGFYVALCIRGLDSIASSGIANSGFALLSLPAVFALFAVPPFLIVSALYAFLFWSRTKRGATLSARFWVPIYGSVLLATLMLLMVFLVLSHSPT